MPKATGHYVVARSHRLRADRVIFECLQRLLAPSLLHLAHEPSKRTSMSNTWILTIALLTFFTALTAFISIRYYKRNNEEKMWKLLGLRIGHMQEAVIVGMGLTVCTLLVMKWSGCLV